MQLTHPPATLLLPSHSSHPQAREFKAQFALRPQHAEGGADAQLLFRMLRDGRLVLVPTEMRYGVEQSGDSSGVCCREQQLGAAAGNSICSSAAGNCGVACWAGAGKGPALAVLAGASMPQQHHKTARPCLSPANNKALVWPRSARLSREVETFIDRFRSVPAFTANLTMELFQKQTQC